MKKIIIYLLTAVISSCSNTNSLPKEKTELDINEARIACEKLDIKYKNIYKDWLNRNNIKYREQDNVLYFEYQNGSFCINIDPEEREYFYLIMPSIAEINDNNFGDMLVAIMETNRDKKCVKCFTVDGDVWLSTEILLDQTPEIELIMPNLLNRLHAARLDFYSKTRKK